MGVGGFSGRYASWISVAMFVMGLQSSVPASPPPVPAPPPAPLPLVLLPVVLLLVALLLVTTLLEDPPPAPLLEELDSPLQPITQSAPMRTAAVAKWVCFVIARASFLRVHVQSGKVHQIAVERNGDEDRHLLPCWIWCCR
jgi:hypothetical protein